MRAALHSFAGGTKKDNSFVRIRLIIDPRSLIWVAGLAFLCKLGKQHNLHRARRLEAQIIGDKEITPSR
jgi:hypothetical protein